MTTTITVKALYGWPVKVSQKDPTTYTTTVETIVPDGSSQDFYVHSNADLMIHEIHDDAVKPQVPTYGQKAVGLDFNPSGDPKVRRLKELYAEIIDIMDDVGFAAGKPSGRNRLASISITEAQGAQMWAVKAATWKD